MDDVKKTWCAPAWLLDPERLERQLDRLSAEGWQLEGTGWLSFRYRRGKPNEYRYRVQYLYESRDGQRDDYVRGLLAAFWLVLAAGPLRRAAVWYGRILEYAADLTAESGIDLPRLWAERIIAEGIPGSLWLVIGIFALRQAYRSAKRLRRLRQARLIEE